MSPKKIPAKKTSKVTASVSRPKSKKVLPAKKASARSATPVKKAKSPGKKTAPKSAAPSASKKVAKAKPAKKAAVKLTVVKKATKKPTTSSKLKSQAVKKPLAVKSIPKPTVVAKSLSGSKPTQPALRKSGLQPSDHAKFRALLLTLRARLIGDVNMMSQEALGSEGSMDNHAPIHPAEVGTHSFEQEFTLNLLSSDGDRLDQIEAALEKIGDGSYGACDECGGRIPKARLELIPDAPFCIKCATKLES